MLCEVSAFWLQCLKERTQKQLSRQPAEWEKLSAACRLQSHELIFLVPGGKVGKATFSATRVHLGDDTWSNLKWAMYSKNTRYEHSTLATNMLYQQNLLWTQPDIVLVHEKLLWAKQAVSAELSQHSWVYIRSVCQNCWSGQDTEVFQMLWPIELSWKWILSKYISKIIGLAVNFGFFSPLPA